MIAGRIYGPNNREGLPADWLAETKPIRRVEDAPEGWLVFADDDEVKAYLAPLRKDYDLAIAARPAPPPDPPTLDQRVAALEARVATLEQRR